MKSLFEHKSIRNFSNKKIEEAALQRILEAATRASNTGNMQLYSIIVTTDSERKQELCTRAHFNQKMVAQAPVLLTFCADLHRFSAWCTQRGAEPKYDNFLSFYTASIDAVIAAQNACIAAEELGFGICYLGTTNYCADAIIDILKLPKLVVPVTSIVIGHPADNPELTDRLPQRAVVHREMYEDFLSDEINSLYKTKEEMQLYKQYVKDSDVETLAHVFTKKRYTKENNILFSQKMLETLHKQEFMNNH